jgi:hypothetical protein
MFHCPSIFMNQTNTKVNPKKQKWCVHKERWNVSKKGDPDMQSQLYLGKN